MKQRIAAALAALTVGLGVFASAAAADAGPVSGRYINALSPTMHSCYINFNSYVYGNGTASTAWHVRLMIRVNGVWNQKGSAVGFTIPADNDIHDVYPSPYKATSGSWTYRVEAKPGNWSWSNADVSGAASYNCP